MSHSYQFEFGQGVDNKRGRQPLLKKMVAQAQEGVVAKVKSCRKSNCNNGCYPQVRGSYAVSSLAKIATAHVWLGTKG